MKPSRVVPSVTLLFAMVALGAAPVGAQFGVFDKVKRAQEELKKTKEAAEKAKKDEAEAKKAPGPESSPAAAASPAAPAATAPAAVDAAPSFQSYSKFDFVPGEKVVAVEDFTQDAIGDFPAKWNTDAAGEIVTLAGQPGRWLKLTRAGFFTPEFITDLPENVTIEFDMVVPPAADPGFALTAVLVQLTDLKRPTEWQTAPNNVQVNAHPSASGAGRSSMITRQDSTSAAANSTDAKALTATKGKPVHLALWRQRQRVRVYMNDEKVWDIPRAVSASAKLNSMVFFIGGGCGNCEYYLANLRVATGAPDTRNKILTEGKWVSHGILFDVNSDRIKPESYGSLKEIAGVLTENADLKVQIVGHTDSDGDDAANLDLSRRRAASVKTALATEFKIDGGRMDTDGKGETQPVDKNDNPAGKANNRRVEFIRK
jgi:outer membrane protein OmpA-like peptidoglycan-associated protein